MKAKRKASLNVLRPQIRKCVRLPSCRGTATVAGNKAESNILDFQSFGAKTTSIETRMKDGHQSTATISSGDEQGMVDCAEAYHNQEDNRAIEKRRSNSYGGEIQALVRARCMALHPDTHQSEGEVVECMDVTMNVIKVSVPDDQIANISCTIRLSAISRELRLCFITASLITVVLLKIS